MLRIVCAATVLGMAFGQVDQVIKEDAKQSVRDVGKLDGKLEDFAAINNVIAQNSGPFSDAMVNTDGIVAAAAAANGAVAGLAAKSDFLVWQNQAAIERRLSGAEQAMDDQLETALIEISKMLSTQQHFVDTDLMGRLEGAEDKNADLKDETDTLLDRLEAHKECNADGQYYSVSEGKCMALAIVAVGKVNHAFFTAVDGRESGYVDARVLKVHKTQDDTYLRIFYHDNFRVHGHGSWARWNVMICDDGGNGCASCNDPGQLQYWRYAEHCGNWWMNDHWSGSVAGLCKSSDNRNLKAGDYQIRIMIDNDRYDIYTGHNQGNSLQADEVYKY